MLLLLTIACGSQSLSNRHPQLVVSPAALDFGTVDGRSPVSKQLTLTNNGTATLNIRSVAITEDPVGAFSEQGAPTQLEAGSSATLTVVMTPPVDAGLYGGSLTITSDASNAPQLLIQLSVRVTQSAGQDAGPTDAGPTDAGAVDAGTEDAGSFDAGPEDAGPPDAGVADAGSEDAGTPDAGNLDAGSECSPGQTLCGSTCSDTQSDPNNCGMCGSHCWGMNQGCSAGRCVTCAPTDGYVTLASGQRQPYDLAVDQNSLYWTTQLGQTVMKVALTGGPPVTLVDSSEFPSPATLMPTRLTSDASNVYFANETMYSVMKVGLNGGPPVNLGGMGAWPGKVAVTATDVYWVTQTTGDVWKAPISGGSATILVPAPMPGTSGEQYDLVGVDATSVYWLAEGSPGNQAADGAVMKVGLNGGTPVTVVSGLSETRDATLDATNIYWTSSVSGTVSKAPIAGGPIVTLASGLGSPRRIVVDGSYAYWSAGGTDSSLMSCSGTVQKVGLNGGTVTDVVTGQYSAWAVAVDQTSIYWTDLYNGTVMKTAK